MKRSGFDFRSEIRSRADADRLLAMAKITVQDLDPGTLGGFSARRVLLGCIDRFQRMHTVKGPLGVRAVAEAAQVHKNTAHRWLRHLTSIEVVRRFPADRPNLADTYWLNLPKIGTLLPVRPTHRLRTRYVPSAVVSKTSVFRHGFLNESGWLTVTALFNLDFQAETGRIVEQSGLAGSTVNSALRKLESHGVVKHVKHGWWQLVDLNFEHLAVLAGSAKVEEAHQRRHALDQAGYGQHIIEELARTTGEQQWTGLRALSANSAVSVSTGEVVPVLG